MTNSNANDKAHGGQNLRAARERLGVTRAELAGLAGCATSSLGFIEQGAVPKRSEVLARAWAVIEQLDAEQAATIKQV
jgi:DNA-binding XRE family transcriptional regulator